MSVTSILFRVCVTMGSMLFFRRAMKKAAELCWSTYRGWLLTRDMPGPKPLPLLGNFPEIWGPHEQLTGKVLKMFRRYETIIKFWVGPKLIIGLREPDDVQMLLTHPHFERKSNMYEATVPVLGKGLVVINAPDYRRHRKAISPSLHLGILNEFVPVFAKNSKRLTEHLEKFAVSGNVFDIKPLCGVVTSTTLCETVLSTDTSELQQDRDAFVTTIKRSNKLIMFRAARPWYYVDFIFRTFSKFYPEWCKMVSSVDGFVSKVLETKLAAVAAGKKSTYEKTQGCQAFLDHFLASPERHALSKEELREELKTLLFGGSSTSMEFLSFFFVTMSLLPDVQKKVQQEIDDVFGNDPGRAVKAADLPHFTYLERVLKETLRYFPPVPVLGREASEDIKLPSGYLVAKGTTVGVLPSMLHRDERYFPDALKFDPDRFLPENSSTRHPFAFVPFSAGSRICVGWKFGLMLAKTATATALRDFNFLPDSNGPKRLQDVRTVSGLSMSIEGGANVRVERRVRSLEISLESPPRHSDEARA